MVSVELSDPTYQKLKGFAEHISQYFGDAKIVDDFAIGEALLLAEDWFRNDIDEEEYRSMSREHAERYAREIKGPSGGALS
ncbi:MAG: hypothetical protein ABSG45_03950 [Nitrososphaerales archaeon]|jgi:hypothetical protein